MIDKKIHKDMVQILAEDSPSSATVKKWAAEFKRSRDSTGRSKISTLMNKLIPFTVWFWTIDVLLSGI